MTIYIMTFDNQVFGWSIWRVLKLFIINKTSISETNQIESLYIYFIEQETVSIANSVRLVYLTIKYLWAEMTRTCQVAWFIS